MKSRDPIGCYEFGSANQISGGGWVFSISVLGTSCTRICAFFFCELWCYSLLFVPSPHVDYRDLKTTELKQVNKPQNKLCMRF